MTVKNLGRRLHTEAEKDEKQKIKNANIRQEKTHGVN